MDMEVRQPATMPATKPGQRRKIISMKMIVEMMSIMPKGSSGLSSTYRLNGGNGLLGKDGGISEPSAED